MYTLSVKVKVKIEIELEAWRLDIELKVPKTSPSIVTKAGYEWNQ